MNRSFLTSCKTQPLLAKLFSRASYTEINFTTLELQEWRQNLRLPFGVEGGVNSHSEGEQDESISGGG